MFRRSVQMGECALPPANYSLAVWRSNLARVIGDGGDRHATALSLLESSLEGFESEKGSKDLGTLEVMEWIACLHIQREEWRLAEDMLESILDGYKKGVGVNHPHAIAAAENLEKVWDFQGKEVVDPFNLDPVKRCRDTLSEREYKRQHLSVEPAITGLAQLLQYGGSHEEALQLFARAVDCLEPALGSSHPRVGVALNNQALALIQVGRLDEAEVLLQRVVRILAQAYGKEHPLYFWGVNNLAGVAARLGRLQQAENLLRECSEMARSTLGPRHPDVAVYSLNLSKITKRISLSKIERQPSNGGVGADEGGRDEVGEA